MILPEWFDLDGRLTGLQEVPVLLQFRPVNLGPGFHEPLLRLRQAAPKALERVYSEDCRVLLIVRVEMRPVVGFAGFDEHPDHDPLEARDLGHASIL